MKKIIFVTESLVTIGGVVRVITNWSNYFVSKGYEVENVSVKQGKPYFDLDNRVKFTIFDIKFRYKILKLFDILPNTIKMYKFLKLRDSTNIVFNKSLYIEPIWILRKLGLFKNINLIYMHHGGSSGFRSFYLSRKGTSHRVSMIFKAFDKVICLYDDEKQYPKQVDKSKLYFIPNPLTFERSDIALEDKENIVLSLGRVTKAKGIDTLINAWKKVEASLKTEWKLLIVGDGEDKEKFIQLSKELNLKNITFIDGTSDIKQFYEKSKIFVIPSVAEGFPMTIVEAMAYKCCVISSKTAGGIKLVDENSGILFDIGDKEALANNLNSLINNSNLIQTLALSAYEDIKNYEIKNLEKLWGDIFE